MTGGAGGNRGRRRAASALGALAVAAAAAAATASSFAGQQPPALATAANAAGTCHRMAAPEELSATVSDTSPAVPCTAPHQVETAWQVTLRGPLARQPTRPNPELLDATWARACDDYYRIRAYLGAHPPDVYWGISAWARFPTIAEWARGVRTEACELSDDPATPSGPVLTQPLGGVLDRPGSAAFRLCRAGPTDVTCARPHDAEAVSPNVVLTEGAWPGPAAVSGESIRACTPIVERYLGAPLATQPDLYVLATPPDRSAWDAGRRSADCWIGSHRSPVTGTVRGAG